jgi:hypothetical protein
MAIEAWRVAYKLNFLPMMHHAEPTGLGQTTADVELVCMRFTNKKNTSGDSSPLKSGHNGNSDFACFQRLERQWNTKI